MPPVSEYVIRSGGVNGKSVMVTSSLEEAAEAVMSYLRQGTGETALAIEVRRVLSHEEAMSVIRGDMKNMSESVASINQELQQIQQSFEHQVEGYKHLTEAMAKMSDHWREQLRQDLLTIEQEMGDEKAWK